MNKKRSRTQTERLRISTVRSLTRFCRFLVNSVEFYHEDVIPRGPSVSLHCFRDGPSKRDASGCLPARLPQTYQLAAGGLSWKVSSSSLISVLVRLRALKPQQPLQVPSGTTDKMYVSCLRSGAAATLADSVTFSASRPSLHFTNLTAAPEVPHIPKCNAAKLKRGQGQLRT